MALQIVPTPIGNEKDISLRALQVIKECDLIIGEERKVLSRNQRVWGTTKPFKLLNEHSTPDDIEELINDCATKEVVLVSDAGTPGFCDPGAPLVKSCRKRGIKVTALPGPSSLMTTLSVSGRDLKNFLFLGFLSPKTEERTKQLGDLRNSTCTTILMDTPYRFKKLLGELAQLYPKRGVFIGIDLTQPTEEYFDGNCLEASKTYADRKAEFVLLLDPQ